MSDVMEQIETIAYLIAHHSYHGGDVTELAEQIIEICKRVRKHETPNP